MALVLLDILMNGFAENQYYSESMDGLQYKDDLATNRPFLRRRDDFPRADNDF